MRSRPSLPAFLLTLALAFVLGACGGENKTPTTGPTSAQARSMLPPTAETPDNLGLLVPEGTQLLAYVPNLASFLEELQGAVAIFDEDEAEDMSLDKLLQQIPFGDLMEVTKPMAVAMSFRADGKGDPIVTAILPVTDTAKANEALKGKGGREMTVSGSYVAMMPTGGDASPVAKSVPAIARGIPSADIVVRADLALLRTVFAKQIDEGLEEITRNVPRGGPSGGMDLSSMMKGFGDFAKTLLDSAEGFDLMLDVDDSLVNLHGMFTAKAGSELDGAMPGATNVAPALSRLPGGFPLAMLFSGDMSTMPKWVEDFMMKLLDAYPPELGDLLKKLIVKQKDYAKHLGNIHAAVMDFGTDGMQLVAVSQVKDGAAYLKAVEAYYQDPDLTAAMAKMGIEMEMLSPTKVAGVDVHHYRMAIDFEKMMQLFAPGKDLPPEARDMVDQVFVKLFGPDGLVVHYGVTDGYAFTVLGGGDAGLEQAVTAAKGGGTLKDDLAGAMKVAGGSPSCLVYIDGRGIAQGVLDLVRQFAPERARDEIPVVRDGDPVPLVIYGGADGRYYMGGLSVDLMTIKTLVGEFMK